MGNYTCLSIRVESEIPAEGQLILCIAMRKYQ